MIISKAEPFPLIGLNVDGYFENGVISGESRQTYTSEPAVHRIVNREGEKFYEEALQRILN